MRANQFALQLNGSTTTVNTQAFNFGAALMKIVVDSGGPIYVQLNGNAATTADYKLTSADTLTDWYDVGSPFSGISIAQQYTSAVSTAGLTARIGAWG